MARPVAVGRRGRRRFSGDSRRERHRAGGFPGSRGQARRLVPQRRAVGWRWESLRHHGIHRQRDAGLFFKVTPGGTLTTPHLFTAGGSYCKAALAQFPNGVFYGVTQQGGAMGDGTIFGVTPAARSAPCMISTLRSKARLLARAWCRTERENYYGSCDLEGPSGGGTIYSVSLTSSSNAQSAQSQVRPSADVSPTDLISFRIVFDEDSPADGHTDFELMPPVLGREGLKLIFNTPVGSPTYIEGYTPPSAGPSSSSRALSTLSDASSMGDLAPLYTFTGGRMVPPAGWGCSRELTGTTTARLPKVARTAKARCFGHAGWRADHAARLQRRRRRRATASRTHSRDGRQFLRHHRLRVRRSEYFATTGNGTVFKITPAGVLTTLHTSQATAPRASSRRPRCSRAAMATSTGPPAVARAAPFLHHARWNIHQHSHFQRHR